MASKKEIEQHLKIALNEIGVIKPRFIKRFNVWVFKHRLYPDVECAEDAPEKVIKNYPNYLREFIKHRLDQNIWGSIEKKTKGHGGKRAGAGRPRGTKKEPKKRVYLPLDVANWFGKPGAISEFRQYVAKGCVNRIN